MRLLFQFLLALLILVMIDPAYSLDTKAKQVIAMEAVIAELETHYGMAEFKEETYGINLNDLRKKYKKLIQEGKTLEEALNFQPPNAKRSSKKILSREEFQQLMIGMIAELRDGHVNITRQSHDSRVLGLYAAAIDGRLYITGVNRDLIHGAASELEIQAGDEVLTLNGESIQSIAQKQIIYAQSGTYDSRRQEATEHILARFGMIQILPPIGDPVVLELKRKDRVYRAHLNWISGRDFRKARSQNPEKFDLNPIKAQSEELPVAYGSSGMVMSHFRAGLIAKKLPPGTLIEVGQLLNLEIEKAKKSSTEPLSKLSPIERIKAYIVRHKGKNIAVLRIPSYSTPKMLDEVRWIREVLNRFQNMADVMILDVLSNSGGSVYYGLRLLEMLTGEAPMQTIKTNTRITETLVYNSIELGKRKNMETDRDLNWGENFLTDLEEAELELAFHRGQKWTGPKPNFTNIYPGGETGLLLQDKKSEFKLPFVVAVDSRSASGGDFIPGILQANMRALLFGDTSKGLGGPVYRKIDSMPGSEMSFRCTMGYCVRADGWPIEGIGVVPELYRPVTAFDIHDGFKSYAISLLDAAVSVSEKKPPVEIQKTIQEDLTTQLKPTFSKADLLTLKQEIEMFKSSAVFSRVELNLESDPETLGHSLQTFSDRLIDVASHIQDLTPYDWTQLIFPLPQSLIQLDLILQTLWRKDEVVTRLREMQLMPRFRKKDQLKALFENAASAIERIPGEIRIQNPCSIWLSIKDSNKL